MEGFSLSINQHAAVMYQKTIHHTLSDGTNVKFTIRERTIEGQKYYYANVVNTDSDSYQNLPEEQKETYYGTEITDDHHNSVYYKDPVHLLNDLLIKYGKEWLQTEK